jgi:aryl-phospho-beta-D-glucosidase BglC (GH1 family)
VVLHGVNRSGLEYACIQGYGFFDSPHPDQIDGPAMIAAMKSWAIDVVRVPLNEDCWLGAGAPPGRGGAPYRRIVARYVHALNAAGLYVILDLHWAAPGNMKATKQLLMADHDHAPAFWRSVASTFKRDKALVFDLFNEPFGISWSCWRDGCVVPAGNGAPAYRTAGMQELVDAVRSTGAAQPLLLGGTSYALDLSDWRTRAEGPAPLLDRGRAQLRRSVAM